MKGSGLSKIVIKTGVRVQVDHLIKLCRASILIAHCVYTKLHSKY